MENAKKKLKRKLIASVVITTAVMAIIFMVNVPSLFAQEKASLAQPDKPAQAEQGGPGVVTADSAVKADVSKFALIAAALAFGFGAIGAGIAVGNVGSAAMGAIGEKPEIAGQAIIFVALAEGLAIFGFIVAILILAKA